MKSKVLLIENDCIDAMKKIPDGSVNLILCDLPYGTTQNAWDSVIPLHTLWEHYRRILDPKGVVALMGQGSFTARVILSQEPLFKYKITWVKSKPTNFLNAKKQPLRKHEDICIFYARQPKYCPQMSPGNAYDKGVRKNQLTGSYGDFRPARIKSDGERYPTDVVYFKTAEAEGRVWHSTQKPVELGRYLIRTYTAPGDEVLDNCFGSASFLVAAATEKRNAIGIEKNRDVAKFKKAPIDLIDVAKERLNGLAEVSVVSHLEQNILRSRIREHLSTSSAFGRSKANNSLPNLFQARQSAPLNSFFPAPA
uniref:Methyltransferase n=1 Tax=Candidatus Kentrum sp. MB TaxID=2138164 RepID=A0A450Y1Y6_9GAMM|nr:MAG: site-specific DNA-methyltransferase (adenine-specific)/modification methylase [Candidatus Kentron sp. MB]VFK35554.1 MAG: site-specific DNA-methyltransferase (adenine-specific)/modification methylase [Candidatus Kentron sp. MB]VFK77390.1 MAG: site-specific DNA-methyltransferase (adenine-specific)/modification methylase [Candidatus Kentron sp. MB]